MEQSSVDHIYRIIRHSSRSAWGYKEVGDIVRIGIRTEMPLQCVSNVLRGISCSGNGTLGPADVMQTCFAIGEESDEMLDRLCDAPGPFKVDASRLSTSLQGNDEVAECIIARAVQLCADHPLLEIADGVSADVRDLLSQATMIQIAAQSAPDLELRNRMVLAARTDFPGDRYCKRAARTVRVCLERLMAQQMLLVTALNLSAQS